MAEEVPDLMNTFHSKYTEFAADLLETFSELSVEIKAALEIPKDERPAKYKESVLPASAGQKSSNLANTPGTVLPGVSIPQEIWDDASKKTKSAVVEYISIMNLCIAFQPGASDNFTKEWAEKMMKDAQASMSKLDFDSISQTFFKAFGTTGASKGMPPLPEKFLKGKLAKLAEEMVREFKPEDFGIKPEEMEECEKNPQRAFEILMGASSINPQIIQQAMMRIAKKLQEKVSRGELKPQELVAEAEELMTEFKSHPAFVELMETFRSAFGTDDMDAAKAQGRENEGRLSAVRARLRKKLDAKKGK